MAVHGTVRSLHEGKWIEVEARHGGKRQNDQGHTAVIDLGDETLCLPPRLPGALRLLRHAAFPIWLTLHSFIRHRLYGVK